MHITIKKFGRWGVFQERVPDKLGAALYNRLSYERKGIEFMPNKNWGIVRFYQRTRQKFPWGLLDDVEKIIQQWCEQYGDTYNIVNISRFNTEDGQQQYTEIEGMRPYQVETINATLKNGGGVWSIPTGGGKTKTALSFIKILKPHRALITVTTIDLKNQWKKEIAKYGLLFIEVKTYQSIKMATYPELAKYRVVIEDECLTYGTQIETDKGRLRIGDIVNKKIKAKVLSYNFKKECYEFQPIVGFFKSEEKRDIYQVKLINKKTGRRIKISCTKEHQWIVKTGKKSTIFLKKGDVLFHKDYVCPYCNKVIKNEKSIGGHININHLNKNQDRSQAIRNRAGQTISKKIRNGSIPNPFLKVGNGRGMSGLEKYFYDTFLDKDWKYNFVISSGHGRPKEYANCYKIDFYNQKLEIGIEVDGKGCHGSKKQKMIDFKKMDFLYTKGYKILRLPEQELKTFKNKGDFKKWMNGK